MSRIRGSNTVPELTLRRALYSIGVRGWRLHSRKLPGTPDLSFTRWRVAVFVDGTFWHGHPSKYSPGRLSPYWDQKIARNQQRDQLANESLAAMGWKVIRFWDKDVLKDPIAAAHAVALAVGEARERHRHSQA